MGTPICPDLLVDRGTPSLLHSTETVEDGGGLTLQGSTAVWPTNASTTDGSLLSMVTAATVKLKTRQVRGREEEGRVERRDSHFMLYCWKFEQLHKEYPRVAVRGGRGAGKRYHRRLREEQTDGQKTPAKTGQTPLWTKAQLQR